MSEDKSYREQFPPATEASFDAGNWEGLFHVKVLSIVDDTIKLQDRVGIDYLFYLPKRIRYELQYNECYIIRLDKTSTLREFLWNTTHGVPVPVTNEP